MAKKANNPLSDVWLLIEQNDTTVVEGDSVRLSAAFNDPAPAPGRSVTHAWLVVDDTGAQKATGSGQDFTFDVPDNGAFLCFTLPVAALGGNRKPTDLGEEGWRRMDRTTQRIREPSSNVASPDRLLKVKDAAEILQVSVRKLNAMLATGELPRRKLGRATRVPLSSVMAVVEGRGA